MFHDVHVFSELRLSATGGICEPIVSAEKRGEGASHGVAVRRDRGRGGHPVVQHPLLACIHVVLLQSVARFNLGGEIQCNIREIYEVLAFDPTFISLSFYGPFDFYLMVILTFKTMCAYATTL